MANTVGPNVFVINKLACPTCKLNTTTHLCRLKYYVFKVHNSGFITGIPIYPNNSAILQTLQQKYVVSLCFQHKNREVDGSNN